MPADLCANVVETDILRHFAYRIEHVTDSAVTAADVIEVFAVTPRTIEPEFVKTGSTSEDEILAKERMVGELDDEPGKYKVLFDVFRSCPRNLGSPVCDVGGRDHRSCSIRILG